MMEKSKQFKDSVHGYVSIPAEFVRLIDTFAFQRLRRLEQTSYRCLYPSARHDRFIHSIGVYHLGKQAYDAIEENNRSSDDLNTLDGCLEKYKKPFLTACLLHDVGHAPFSHTLEEYYNIDEMKSRIVAFIIACNSDSEFDIDLESDACSPAPHELMSVLVMLTDSGLNTLSFLDDNADMLEFSARAIIGCQYNVTGKSDKDRDILDFKNALIRVLNSRLIDVDKLDYVVRDAATSGYRNVEMDLPRLMSSYSIVRNDKRNGRLWPAYQKSALSIIEHIFFARNNEIRWIQAHNIIVYETYLLQKAIIRLAEVIGCNTDDIFCFESLTEHGKNIDKFSFRLLADEDVLSLLKQHFDVIPEVKEYFNRSLRKRAIWKTHSDYIATLNGDAMPVVEKFNRFFKNEISYPYVSVNAESFAEFFGDDESENKEKSDWQLFFKKLNYDVTSEGYEILLHKYNAERFTRQFNADEVFLSYSNGCKSYADILKENSAEQPPEIQRGFFVYYSLLDERSKIKPKEFYDCLKRYVLKTTEEYPS